MNKYLLLASIPLLAFTPHTASAQGAFSLSIGYYDVFDDQDGADFRAEYRMDEKVIVEGIKPFIGGEVTSEGSLWGGGGVLFDWNIAENIFLTPSAGVGLYTDGGSDVDLDYPLQLRTQLEASYAFRTGNRISLGLSHMSNAGLGDSNPGTEVLSVGYILSLD